MSGPLNRLANRIRLAIAKSLLKAVDDSKGLQIVRLQVLSDEDIEGIERLQSYGLTTNPPLNSEAIAAEVGGSRDNLVALVIDSAAYRVKNLESGEVVLYCQHGQTIKHDKDGDTLYDGGSHKFNSGGRAGARVDDSTLVDDATDANFIAWLAAAQIYLSALATAAGATMPAQPTTVIGKITTGSASVELPND